MTLASELDPKEATLTYEDAVVRELLETCLEESNAEKLNEFFHDLPAFETLRHVLHLQQEDRDQFFDLIDLELASALVEEAPDEMSAALLERVDSKRAAKILGELTSDEQADIIHELDDEDAEAILDKMSVRNASDIRSLMQYDPETAGGLMGSEIFMFRKDKTVAAVLKRLASDEEDFERYRGQHPYIVNSQRKLVGVVSLRAMLTAKRSAELTEIMIVPDAVTVETPLEELDDIFEEHPYLGVPVVDNKGKLIGVVSRASVADAMLERSEREALARQGVVGDELRSMPTWLRSRRRLAWLSGNIVLNVIAASVISAYEETLAAVIAIAVFLPMVSDMSGCSGNQAVGVSMRELALGLARPADVVRVWLKEVSVGVINGVILGLLIGIVAWVWKGNAYLGLVIGLALALNTIIAVSIGGTVPLVLKRFGVDPAVASGPLLTTVTDMAGFFLVLSLATLFMPLLLS